MDFREFVRTVATRTDLSRQEAAGLSYATLETLAHQLSARDALDLTLALPEELADSVRRGSRICERISFTQLVRKVSARTGISEAEADKGVRVVLSTFREAVGEEEFNKAMSHLRREFSQAIA
jgi:uncharacterized protein (DUF2267 family)